MTRDARSPDTAIRLGKIGVSPGPHRPELPTKPIGSLITPQHRFCPARSDQIRRRPASRSDGRDGRNRPIAEPQEARVRLASISDTRLAAGFTRRTRHARRPRGFFHPTEAGTAPLRPNRTAGSRSPDRHPKGSGLIVPMSPEQSHKAPCENHR